MGRRRRGCGSIAAVSNCNRTNALCRAELISQGRHERKRSQPPDSPLNQIVDRLRPIMRFDSERTPVRLLYPDRAVSRARSAAHAAKCHHTSRRGTRPHYYYVQRSLIAARRIKVARTGSLDPATWGFAEAGALLRQVVFAPPYHAFARRLRSALAGKLSFCYESPCKRCGRKYLKCT
jgi:hypothetical protein